jgi:virginiamycin A acetyltransferase
MTGPDPDMLHPLPEHPRVVFLRPLAEGRANVTVGQCAYYDDPDAATAFFERNVLHHHDFLGDHLTIGAFAAIAAGARIVMNGANHDRGGFSTFPFDIFAGWGPLDLPRYLGQSAGDTLIGPDVWIGAEAWILPGVTIGAGAIVGARAVVNRDVPPYSVVVGNPARIVRHRFDTLIVRRLLDLAWWDWPLDRIGRNLAMIRDADIDALEACR